MSNEKSNGRFCGIVPTVPCPPECDGIREARVGFFECGNPALEGQSRPAYADAENQATAKAIAAARLYDEKTSGLFSEIRKMVLA